MPVRPSLPLIPNSPARAFFLRALFGFSVARFFRSHLPVHACTHPTAFIGPNWFEVLLLVLPNCTGEGQELGAIRLEVAIQALKLNWPIAVAKKNHQHHSKLAPQPDSCHCEVSDAGVSSPWPLRWRAWRWGSRQNGIPHHILPPGEVGAGGGYAPCPSDPASPLFLIRPRVPFFCAPCWGSSLRGSSDSD